MQVILFVLNLITIDCELFSIKTNLTGVSPASTHFINYHVELLEENAITFFAITITIFICGYVQYLIAYLKVFIRVQMFFGLRKFYSNLYSIFNLCIAIEEILFLIII